MNQNWNESLRDNSRRKLLKVLGVAAMLLSGCATNTGAPDASGEDKSNRPNMTSELNLGDTSAAILSKYGKPLQKKATTNPDGKKLEDWFYPDAILYFKDGSLDAFKPK